MPLTPIGESRTPNIPRLGDVVLINTGDGVFTGREPHTSLQLMIKFNQTVLAAVSSIVLFGAALTLITPPPTRAELDKPK